MPVPPNYQIEVKGDLLSVRVCGPLLADGVIDVVKAHYPAFHGRHLLWDLTAADLSGFGDADFPRIAIAVRENTPRDIQRQTAYVVANQAAYVVLWKYLGASIRIHVPVEYQVFWDMAAARRWLNEP